MQQDRVPPARYVPADQVIGEIIRWGRHRIRGLGPWSVLTLGTLGGAFIATGALLSLLLASGYESAGGKSLIEGFGFSAGFFFVVLSEAALFTEANVVMPATLISGGSDAFRVLRFWALAIVGNVLGAALFAWVITTVGIDDPGFDALLAETVDSKMRYQAIGGVEGWFKPVLSGVAANWLVGMAAFFGVMGRSIVGKYIPVFLAVTTFVAAGLQHSPANLGYFSLSILGGEGPAVADAVAWNLIPAGLGNVIGGTLLVALPFWLIYGRRNSLDSKD